MRQGFLLGAGDPLFRKRWPKTMRGLTRIPKAAKRPSGPVTAFPVLSGLLPWLGVDRLTGSSRPSGGAEGGLGLSGRPARHPCKPSVFQGSLDRPVLREDGLQIES